MTTRQIHVGDLFDCQYPSSKNGQLELRTNCRLEKITDNRVTVYWEDAPSKPQYRSFFISQIILNTGKPEVGEEFITPVFVD